MSSDTPRRVDREDGELSTPPGTPRDDIRPEDHRSTEGHRENEDYQRRDYRDRRSVEYYYDKGRGDYWEYSNEDGYGYGWDDEGYPIHPEEVQDCYSGHPHSNSRYDGNYSSRYRDGDG